MKKRILAIIVLLILLSFSASDLYFAAEKPQATKIPILMYHHISNDVSSISVVTPFKFLNDMKVLKSEGYTGIFLTEIVDYLNGHIELPEKPIVITFDDGYFSNYRHAFPIAKYTDMKITISVIGWSMGRDTLPDDSRPIIEHFGWDETREMLESGYVDIQNHTMDLHSPAGKSYGLGKKVGKGVLKLEDEPYADFESRIKNDLLTLNVTIFNETNHMPTFFIYPFGAHDENTERALSKLAFTGTLTTIEGVREFRSLEDLKLVPRLNVPNDLTGQDLIDKIENLESK